jgi:hypothetical protein
LPLPPAAAQRSSSRQQDSGASPDAVLAATVMPQRQDGSS